MGYVSEVQDGQLGNGGRSRLLDYLPVVQAQVDAVMDEAREEREELAALEAEVDDLRREQEAEERFWTGGFDSAGMHGTRFNPGDGTKADHP